MVINKKMGMPIEVFNFNNLRKSNTILIIGDRGSGKSTLIKRIVESINHNVELKTAISPSDDISDCHHIVHKSLSPSLLSKLVTQCGQNQHVMERKERVDHVNHILSDVINLDVLRYILQPYVIYEKLSLITFDDCIINPQLLRSDDMRSIFLYNRHFFTYTILSSQGGYELSPQIRKNINYVILTRITQANLKRKLYDHYFQECNVIDYPAFCQLLDQRVYPYRFLMLDSNINKLYFVS